MAIPLDRDNNENYEDSMAKAKYIILDGIKDHVVPHIAENNTIKEKWNTLTTFYYGTSM